jgi:hypothetical protein
MRSIIVLVSLVWAVGCGGWTSREVAQEVLEVTAVEGDVGSGDPAPGDPGPGHPGPGTGDPVDPNCVAPFPEAVFPAANAIDVEITDTVRATFTESIAPGSVTVDSFYLDDPNVTGSLMVSDRTVIFQPGSPLAFDTTYEATVTGEVTSVVGCPLVGDLRWRFTTEPEPIEPALILNLLLRQDVIGDSGIWFSSQGDPSSLPSLAVTFSEDGVTQTRTYQGGLAGAFGIYVRAGGFEDIGCQARATDGSGRECHRGELLIEESGSRRGLLRVDASDIPPTADIDACVLTLHLHEQQGLAYGDHTSVIGVYAPLSDWDWDTVTWTEPWQSAGGDLGEEILSIRAHEDMHERGWNKASPTGTIDLTDHLRALQAAR